MEIIVILGTGTSVVGLVYMFLRNFKTDISKKIDEIEKHQDTQDDRMFLILTGKSLSESIKEEKMKKEERNRK